MVQSRDRSVSRANPNRLSRGASRIPLRKFDSRIDESLMRNDGICAPDDQRCTAKYGKGQPVNKLRVSDRKEDSEGDLLNCFDVRRLGEQGIV